LKGVKTLEEVKFSEEKVQKVWEKGEIVSDHPERWRKDECKAWIGRKEYGDRNSDWGWEIHHIVPESEGGTDDLYNLCPLQWKNNVATGDSRRIICVVKASGNDNVRVS